MVYYATFWSRENNKMGLLQPQVTHTGPLYELEKALPSEDIALFDEQHKLDLNPLNPQLPTRGQRTNFINLPCSPGISEGKRVHDSQRVEIFC